MRAQRLEHPPDDVEGVRLVERLLGRHLRRDDHGQDYVAEPLLLARPPVGEGAHDAADRLDDVDLAALGAEEDDGVERRHVHALGEAARVREDAALVLALAGGEPVQLLRAELGVHGPVDVVELALRAVLARALDVAPDDLGEGGVDVLGRLDGGAEAHGAVQWLDPLAGAVARDGVAVRVPLVEVVHEEEVRGELRLVALVGVQAPRGLLAVRGEPAPAADDLGGVAHLQLRLVLAVGDDDPRARHRVLVDGEHYHAVVAEQPPLDRLREGELVGDGAVLPLVVHGVELGRTVLR